MPADDPTSDHQPSTPERLARFLQDTVSQFRGTLTAETDEIWAVGNPAKQPNLFGPDGMRVTTDKEASGLDPELSLLAEGTPLLQTLTRRIREQGLVTFKGRFTRTWPTAAVTTRLNQGLIPPDTPIEQRQEEQRCLRAVFRVRLQREFVQEDVMRIVVDGEGGAWSDALPLEGQAEFLQPQPQLAWDWATLQERYQQALLAAEEALMPVILEHEAELAELLRRETQRITAYYDEVESSGEYAENIDDVETLHLALEALHADRTKLLAEQRHRYRLAVQILPVSIGLLAVTATRVTAGPCEVVFHPLLAEPILPPCDGCARRMPIARFAPGPLCSTCAAM